jgi:hypothetical protein
MPTPLGTPPSVGSITNQSDPLNVRELHHLQLGLPGHLDRRGAICQVRAMARSDAEEVSAVLSAHVLIQTEVGKVARVAQALSDVSTGTHVSRLTSLAQDVTAMR